jgi:hypothetical protein
MATPLLMSARHFAKLYHFSIIPVDRTSKQPAARWKRYQQRPSTQQEWCGWFSSQYPFNLGIVTGAISGIVVVDVDSDAGRRYVAEHLPLTPMRVTTGGGGEHHYYRHPGGVVSNKVRLLGDAGARVAVDVRADGGYVIGPGSLHPRTGRYYRESEPWPDSLERVPVFDSAWLAVSMRKLPPSCPPPSTSLPLVERARRYLAATPRPEIGCGSDGATFQMAAALVRGFALSTHETTELLWGWCGNRSGWTYKWVARKVQHAERYGTEPIGGRR